MSRLATAIIMAVDDPCTGATAQHGEVSLKLLETGLAAHGADILSGLGLRHA
jgi:hypothetical protein